MKITILTPDVSDNCLGRAWVLAELLESKYDVEIVGPMFGNGVWKPLADSSKFKIKYVECAGLFKPFFKFHSLLKLMDGDVILASKPVFMSYGLGLIKRFLTKKKLILDIDDWELGFVKHVFKEASLFRKFKFVFGHLIFFYKKGSIYSIILLDQLSKKESLKIVSNSFLQKRFGGFIISHARDENLFNPDNYDVSLLRNEFNIPKNAVVFGFCGTPRKHKGIENLITALRYFKNKNIFFVLVGLGKDDYCLKLKSKIESEFPNNSLLIGNVVQKEIPKYISLLDVFVIPQKSNAASFGQIPMKLFDAMAMNKIIISSKVSDIETILENKGFLIDSENMFEFKLTIETVLSLSSSEKKSLQTRNIFLNKYSKSVLSKKLILFMEESLK